jgi:hypothetical protein
MAFSRIPYELLAHDDSLLRRNADEVSEALR